MERVIRISIENIELDAVLNDTKTAEAIWETLPVSVTTNTWGDEIYFSIPVNMDLEKGQEVVSAGDLGYWPTGNAFCIFYGSTPLSQGEEIRPASAVTVFGKIMGDPTILRKVNAGSKITVSEKPETA